MKTYRQDQERHRQFRQISSAAHVFDDPAAEGFVEWLGERGEDLAEKTRAKIRDLFHEAEESLGELSATFDEALDSRDAAEREYRRAGRQQKDALVALRGLVSSTRRLVDGLTGGREKLGLVGPTPREAEKLAACGRILCEKLPGADVPEEACLLLAARAEQIRPRAEALEAAFLRKEAARVRLSHANAHLRQVRGKVDEELGKVKRWLQTSLELAGHDGLAKRVLGKRRGRPRKSLRVRKEVEVEEKPAVKDRPEVELAPTQSGQAGQKLDAAPREAEDTGQESGFAPAPSERDGQKFDSGSEPSVPGAGTALRETEEAPIRTLTELPEIFEAPSEPGAAADPKIGEGLCEPVTELQKTGEGAKPADEAVSFQETPRSSRRRRRRGASAFLKAPARWFSSGWMGRFVSKDRSQRMGGAS